MNRATRGPNILTEQIANKNNQPLITFDDKWCDSLQIFNHFFVSPDLIWLDSIIEKVSCRPLIVNACLELLVELFSLTPAEELLKLRVVDFKPRL